MQFWLFNGHSWIKVGANFGNKPQKKGKLSPASASSIKVGANSRNEPQKEEIITSICHFHRSWCQFWKFLQPNCPLLSYLPSYWRHLCKTFFLLLSLFGGARKSIGSPSGESFCPNQSHSSSWIRKTLHHPFSQTYQCHIKLRGRLWSWRFNFFIFVNSLLFCFLHFSFMAVSHFSYSLGRRYLSY